MEIIENMYYGIGQVALAIALADDTVERNEIEAIENTLLNIQKEKNVDLGAVLDSFKINARDKELSSDELLEKGIKNFHLGDLHLTEELAKLFSDVLIALANEKKGKATKERDLLKSFLSYLGDRAKIASYRDRGYLKHVLIPVDFEESTTDVLKQLPVLQKWLSPGFKITLLHCISPEDAKGESFVEKKEEALTKMKALIDANLGEEKGKEQLDYEVLFQRLSYLDQKYLDDNDIDFVIMPTKGKGPGSYQRTTQTSEHIQRHFANYFVLPTYSEVNPLTNVLLVTDYKFTSLDQFEPVLELCKTNDCRVTFLCVGDEDKLTAGQLEKKKALQTYFSDYVEEFFFKELNDHVYNDILSFYEKSDYDLLVALPLHNSFYTRFDGHLSVVKKLCQLTSKPLLVLNQHSKRDAMDMVINNMN